MPKLPSVMLLSACMLTGFTLLSQSRLGVSVERLLGDRGFITLGFSPAYFSGSLIERPELESTFNFESSGFSDVAIYAEFFGLTFTPRYNLVDLSDNSSVSLSMPISWGYVQSLNFKDAEGSAYSHFKYGLFASFNSGYYATQYTRKDHGWGFGVGFLWLQGAQYIPEALDCCYETMHVEEYGYQRNARYACFEVSHRWARRGQNSYFRGRSLTLFGTPGKKVTGSDGGSHNERGMVMLNYALILNYD